MPLRGGIHKRVEEFTGAIAKIQPLAGGDISALYRIQSVRGDFVIKTHPLPPAGFFDSERLGLAALEAAGLDVPKTIATGQDFLLMEYLAPGKPQPALAGEKLAAMHSGGVAQYGFGGDTYLATLIQNNQWNTNAADFYFRQRLQPLLGERETDPWQKFFDKTAGILNSCPAPALLHGDLWSGNLYHASRGPVFIDPAVYFGDPLTDIAMTKLFGGFGPAFYAAYFSSMPRRDYLEELLQIFQIYPLLVHARLFVAGGYYASAARLRDMFL